jgi:hypothetical protein
VVVQLSYFTMAEQGSGLTALSTVDVVRGFDLATGQALWSLDTVADGSRLQVQDGLISATDDRVALVVGVVGLEPAPRGCPRQDLLVVDLRAGTVVSQTGLTPACGRFADGTTWLQYGTIAAYQDGILVVDPLALTEQGAETWAWHDSDLTAPAWTVASPMGGGWWWGPDRVLPGGWVLAWPGRVLGLADGSQWPPGAAEPIGLLSVAGDLILELTPASADSRSWLDAGPGMVVARRGGDTTPLWTYTADPSWLIAGSLYTGTAPLVGVGDEVAVVSELRFQDRVLVGARLTGISLADGARRWTVPYEVPSGKVVDIYSSDPVFIDVRAAATGGIVRLDQRELLVAVAAETMTIVDVDSGEQLATLPWSGDRPPEVYQCGAASACLVVAPYAQYGSLQVDTVDLATGQLTRHEQFRSLIPLAGRPQAYQTPAGLVIIGQGNDQVDFLLG